MAEEVNAPFKKPRLELTSDAPRELSVTDLAQSHAKEIRAMTAAVRNIHKTHNITQTVPHYMRRRAASHNINRLPRKIREALKNHPPPNKPKKHSRYHKRRPKNLMAEYAKRQRRVRWLETHLWHAKRFHMIEKWGHKLPHYPTEKSERSSYRAAINHCLIQDQSYVYCLEVVAPELRMIQVLNTIIREGQLEKGSVEAYTEGRDVLYCTLYRPHHGHQGAVCPVEIMFNPRHKDSQHHIWIWSHTAAYRDVCGIVCHVFRIPVCDADSPFSVSKSADAGVVVRSLKDSFVRFRLNGKKTNELLSMVISPVHTNPQAVGDHVWWTGDFAGPSGEISDNLKDYLLLPHSRCGAVVTVRTRDPRLCMASIQEHMKELKLKKAIAEEAGTPSYYEQELAMTKARPLDHNPVKDNVSGNKPLGEDVTVKKSIGEKNLAMAEESSHGEEENASSVAYDVKDQPLTSSTLSPLWDEGVSSPLSPLWDEGVRNIVSRNVMTQHEINSRRSQMLVPGTEMNLGDEENCVPTVLILNQNMADLILPARWGMPFWLAFTYAGARPGGLRESKMVNFETSRLSFPDDFPDTEACQRQELHEAKELTAKHFKYPPAKRPNFDKLRTNSPFGYNWTSLDDVDKPVVVRDLKLLNALKESSESEGDKKANIVLENITTGFSEEHERRFLLPPRFATVTLIPVSITMLNRGVPEPRAEICLPLESDVVDLKSKKNKYGPMLELYKGKAKSRDPSHSTLPTGQLETGREVLGYVKTGRYSPKSGQAMGFGFMAMMAWCGYDDLTLYSSEENARGFLCLVRNVDSRQYRYALVNVNSTNGITGGLRIARRN